MLNVTQAKPPETQPLSSPPSDGDSPIDLYVILGFLRRQWFPIITTMSVTIIAAVIYCFSTTPKYTAAALVLVDPSNVRTLHDQPGNVDSPTAATIDSQIELCKSERVLLRAVRQFAHDNDSAFTTTSQTNLIKRVWSFLISSKHSSDIPVRIPLADGTVVDLIRNGLEVRRVGFANVIEIKFTAEQPEKAARIANAVANAYLADTLDAKYEVMQRAGGWFRERLKELSRQATAADAAVQEFKAKNNIIDTDRGLMNERQLSEISSQIILARAQVAEAKARWERVEEIMRGDPRSAAVTDSLRNEVMVRLRQQYLDASRQEAEWSMKYGANHLAAIRLRNEMNELLNSIKDELRRIAQSYKNDYEIAKLREDTLQKNLDGIVAQTRTTNQAQVELRELESAARASRALHDSFLKKNMETTQQESFPVTDARIITAAQIPLYRSHPLVKLIVGGSAVFGLFAGLIIALAREAMDCVFRTPEQLRDTLGCATLGILPKIRSVKLPRTTRRARLFHPRNAQPSERFLGEDLGSLHHAIDDPMSQFTETLRNVKIAAAATIMTGSDGKVIGFTSTMPNEGKTFVAANFAELLADMGHRCILVDCDLRNPSITRLLTPSSKSGLVEIINRTARFEETVWTDPKSRMSFLPTTSRAPIHHTSEILASNRMEALVDMLRQRFVRVLRSRPARGRPSRYHRTGGADAPSRRRA